MLALAWAGSHALGLLDRRLEPRVPSPFAAIEVRLPGVSAAELEQLLTIPIERELLKLPAVLDSWAETRDGLAWISVEAGAGPVADGSAWTAIEDRLARLRDELGRDLIGLTGPRLHRPTEQWAEALVSVTWERPDEHDEGPPVEAARELAQVLTAAEGVGHVDLVGRASEQVVLSYEDAELADAGLTPLEFREYLRAQHVVAPGAYLVEAGLIRPIETVSRIRDLETLRQLPVRDPADGDPVSLSRLLELTREPLRPTVSRVATDGQPSLVLAIHRAVDQDLAGFADDVRRIVGRHDGLPGLAADLIVFQPDVVDGEFSRFGVNLAQGFGWILVLLVAALGWRVGLSVALVLPCVVLTSFVVMHAAGLGLDIVSLSSFILVLGLLVDNHIVMAERIGRLIGQGSSRAAAIRQALAELAGPLVAAALTTVLGFLPIVLTDEPVGHYVSALFWVVLIALAVSLLFCFVVTPRLQPAHSPRRSDFPWERRYGAVLRSCLARPLPLLLLVLAVGTGGALVLRSSDQIFFPVTTRPLWMLEVEGTPGTEVETTAALTTELQTLLAAERADPAGVLLHDVTFVGRSAPALQASIPRREFEPHYAQVLLQLDPERDAGAFLAAISDWAAAHQGPARLRLRPVELGAPLEWPVQIEVRGPLDGLHELAERVTARLVEAGCRNVSSDWSVPIPKLDVVPDRVALAERDLTVGDVTLGMHCVVHGLPLFDLLEDDLRVPVMLRAATSRRVEREALADAYVYPAKGDPALLYEVAEIREVAEHPVRVRRRGLPAVTIRGEPEDPRQALALERGLAAGLSDLADSHPTWELAAVGVSASSARADRAMLEGVPWALLAILLCLLTQSGSLLETALVLLTVPLSLAGVAFGLALAGEPLSFMTLVGMTALAGIVVNNAIVLLSSVRRRVREAGRYAPELLVESAAERLRPILLTTCCALASMAVLQLSGGPMWRPLATTVIGGLVLSTALVLFVLPVFFGVCLAREARRGD